MCYFDTAFTHTQEAIDVICHELASTKLDRVDFLVGTGIGGLILLTPISLKSGIPCGAMRKPSDSQHSHIEGGSHSYTILETAIKFEKINRYVILDDITESGKTIERIISQMLCLMPWAKCEAVMLYQEDSSGSMDETNVPIYLLDEDIKCVKELAKTVTC